MHIFLRLGIVKWVYYIIGIITVIFGLLIRGENAFIAWTLIVIGILLVSHGYITSILESTIAFIIAEHGGMPEPMMEMAEPKPKTTRKRKTTVRKKKA